MKVEVGDWVAFLSDRQVVYGRVEYVRPWKYWPHQQQAVTTAGVVDVENILEVRKLCP
jgi:hypothetical protein